MGPRKARARQPNHHHNSSDLDLDSDAPIIPQAVPSAEPLPVRTNDQLNLAVIKHHSPETQSILSIAPFAVIYLFSTSSQSWVKSGIDGTLFVCQLEPATEVGAERYQVFVLNRRGLENFKFEPKNEADVEVSDPYIMLMDSAALGEDDNSPIYGLWIYAAEAPSSTAVMRTINAGLIKDCAMRAETTRKITLGNVDLSPSQMSSNATLSETPVQLRQGPSSSVALDGARLPSLLNLLRSPRAHEQSTYFPHQMYSTIPHHSEISAPYSQPGPLPMPLAMSVPNASSSSVAYNGGPPGLNMIDTLFSNARQGSRANG